MDSTLASPLRAAAATALAVLALLATFTPTAFGAGYVRPRGATPYRTPLVPLYERCETDGGRIADTVHGAPLAYKACKDPELISGMLTHGTPDANGKQANGSGYFTMVVKSGDPATPADEADVKVDMSLTDVRLQAGLGDYAGELLLDLDSRITDMGNGTNENEAGTLEDFHWFASVPCGATSSTSIGSTCALTTTVDTLLPGMIKENRRTVWEQHDHIHVLDGGPDREADTRDDNLLFAVQGVYAP